MLVHSGPYSATLDDIGARNIEGALTDILSDTYWAIPYIHDSYKYI
jgi:hypothetical protein